MTLKKMIIYKSNIYDFVKILFTIILLCSVKFPFQK